MIVGGGNIGKRLAKALENDYQVKIIDHNHGRARKLAKELNNTIVLNGDAVAALGVEAHGLPHQGLDLGQLGVRAGRRHHVALVDEVRAGARGRRQLVTGVPRTGGGVRRFPRRFPSRRSPPVPRP